MLGGIFSGKLGSISTVGLASLVLSLGFGAHIARAEDSNISSFSASVASAEPSATTTYTLNLTTSTQLASGTEIAVAFTSDTGSLGLSSATVTSTFAGSGSVQTSGMPYVKYTLSSAAAAGNYSLTVASITNPSNAGTVTVVISTTGLAGLTTGATDTSQVSIGGGSGDGEDGMPDEGDGTFGRETGNNTITVTVVDENGAPLASQTVWGWCGMSFDEGTTASDGTATLDSLTNGNCGLELASSGGYYAERVYFTFVTSEEAQSEEVTLIGQVLDTSITLTVTQSDGSAAYPAWISLVNEQGQDFSGGTSEDGTVEIPVDYGTYYMSGYFDEASQYFPDQEITVTEDESTQSATVQLEEFSSFISGTVTNADGVAIESPNMLVIENSGDIRFFMGNADGTYEIGVAPGVYTVKAEKNGYANGAVRDITVKADQTKSGKDIALDVATNTLNLSVVEEDGTANTSITGGVMCKDPDGFDPVSVYFAFMSGGSATFMLPDGTVQCSLFTSGYASTSPTFTLSGGETENGEITIINYDSTLVVSLVDQDGNALNDVQFGVFGQTNTGSKTLNGFSMGGTTSIGAAAGTYTLRVFVMDGDYATDFTNPTIVTLVSGEETTASVTVFEKNATLSGTIQDAASGTIQDAAGESVSGATVTAKSENAAKPFEFSTVTDEDGNYSMPVVPATYVITAAKDGVDNLPSVPQSEKITQGEEADVDASLEKTNATLLVSPLEDVDGDIDFGSCYAFEPTGTYVSAELSDGSASLAVNAGEWHYGCRAVIGEKQYVTLQEGIVTVSKDDEVEVDSTLSPLGTGFDTVVYQFSATADSTLTLPDGTTVFVPANALDTEGNVSITAKSAAEVSVDDDEYPIRPITLEARDGNNQVITGNFNGQVTITFYYTIKQLNNTGVDEADLEGQSFKNDAWSTTDQGYTLKKGADYVSITTNHFSTFGLVAPIHTPNKARKVDHTKMKSSSATITWTKPKASKVETYTVQIRPSGSTDKSIWTTKKSITDTSLKFTDLTAGTQYQVRVKACNSQGCSAYTDWEKVTTKVATSS